MAKYGEKLVTNRDRGQDVGFGEWGAIAACIIGNEIGQRAA